jgi:hypothetical protein
MSKIGWFGESHRHYLAAKGVKTANNGYSYFATKTQEQARLSERRRTEALKEQKALKTATEAAIRNRRKGQRLIEATEQGRVGEVLAAAPLEKQGVVKRTLRRVTGGRFGTAQKIASTAELNKLPVEEREAVLANINLEAVDFANAGQWERIEQLRPYLSQDTIRYVDALKQRRQIAQRSAVTRTAVGFGRAAIEGAEAATFDIAETAAARANRSEAEVREERAIEQARLNRAIEATEGLEVKSLSQVNPFFKGGIPEYGEGLGGLPVTNEFLDNYANRDAGKIGDVIGHNAFLGGNLPGTSDGKLNDMRSRGVRFNELKDARYDERVKREVDALYNAKDDLGKVDKKSFEDAKEAYKKGDRIKLIRALNDAEFQVQQQNSRWKLADQTRDLVESQQNREGALDDGGVMSFFSGDKLANQTKKIHAVRKEIKNGHDEASQRAFIIRKMLEKTSHAPREPLPYQSTPGKIDAVGERRTEVFGVEKKGRGGVRLSKWLDTALPSKPVSQSHDFSIIPKGVREIAPKKHQMVKRMPVQVENIYIEDNA